MKLNTYLTFSGQCEAAFRLYEKCLGGKIDYILTHGQSPSADSTPREWHDKIMHAQLSIGDQILMGSDAPPQYQQQPQGFSVNLTFEDADEAERVFQTLSEKGTIRMPLQKTFWAERFGMFVDQFGIPWMINCAGTAASQTTQDTNLAEVPRA